jgi:hypothetical protein
MLIRLPACIVIASYLEVVEEGGILNACADVCVNVNGENVSARTHVPPTLKCITWSFSIGYAEVHFLPLEGTS